MTEQDQITRAIADGHHTIINIYEHTTIDRSHRVRTVLKKLVKDGTVSVERRNINGALCDWFTLAQEG